MERYVVNGERGTYWGLELSGPGPDCAEDGWVDPEVFPVYLFSDLGKALGIAAKHSGKVCTVQMGE